MWHDVYYRLRALARRSAVERELREELEGALAGAELERVKEACRDARGIGWIEAAGRELRLGLRSLRRAPAFSWAAGLTLALGLGAAVAIFSVANGVLLQPLAFAHPSQLMLVRERLAKFSPTPVPVSAPDIPLLRDHRVFDGVAAFESEELDLTRAGATTRIEATRISANLLPPLEAAPALGNNFSPAQDAPGHHVAILSDGLWRERFGADADIVGRALTLDGQPYTVVGVMPRGFMFPPRGLSGSQPAALWVPAAFTPTEMSDLADDFDFGVLARLRPGVGAPAAQAAMDIAAGRIQRAWEQKYGAVAGPARMRLEVVVTPLRDRVVGGIRRLMVLLLGAAGLLLLMSCANAAGLFLVRATARRPELALRAALGAGRRHIARQLVAESLLLSLGAAGMGVLLAGGLLRWFTAAAPDALPQVQAIRLDAWSLSVGLLLALGTGLACGLVPMVSIGRGLDLSLKEGAARATASRRGARWRNSLVVGQIAIAFVLVAASALVIRSFLAVENVDPGVRSAGRMVATLALPAAQFHRPQPVVDLIQQIDGALATQPGILSAGAATDLPTQSNWDHIFSIEHHPTAANLRQPDAANSLVIGDYFQTLGIPLLRGRYFTAAEERPQAPGTPPVVIVSAGLAGRYWPGENPIGKRIKWGPNDSTQPWLTVVGVVGDVRQAALDQPAQDHTYEPYLEECASSDPAALCGTLHLAVRSSLPPPAAAAVLRREVSQLAPGVPLTKLGSVAALLGASVAPRRFNTLLLGAFGGAALLLALIGLYAVLAYTVAEMQGEIALRMVLGARPAEIFSQVLRRGAALAVVGLGLGALAAAGLLRYLASLLYQNGTFDPGAWIGAGLVLALAALLASALSARRALGLDPLTVLRKL